MMKATSISPTKPTQNSLSISQLISTIREPIKKTFENTTYTVYGDVERVNNYQEHKYVTLVDKTGNQSIFLNVFIRNNVLRNCPYPIENQTSLLLTGTITLSTKNEITLIANHFENLGYGLMQAQIEAWKKDYRDILERPKKELPLFCQNIAVISNIETQGFQDLVCHLKYGEITLYQTNMQGSDTAENISKNIYKINQKGGYDCICIIRGGGNYADLFEFNKPVLLKAIADSKIPIITGIGHETDYPLCDLAADLRYPAPAAVAIGLTNRVEILLSDITDIHKEISEKHTRILNLEHQKIKERQLKYKSNNYLILAGVIIVILITYILLNK